MTIHSYINLWLDDARLGCGSRAVLVYDVGHKLARLVEVSTGRATTIDKADLRRAAPIEDVSWRRLAVKLDRVRRKADLWGVRVPVATLKRLAGECRALAEQRGTA